MKPDHLIPGKIRPWATLLLAFRNLTRNRRRTWITATTVAFAVFLMQFMASLLIGIERQSYDNLINYQTAHAKLFAEGYFDEREELPLDYTLTNVEVLESKIQGVEGVAATTPRLSFSAMLSNGVDQLSVIGTGIQLVGSDTDVFRLPQTVVAGSFLQPGEEGMLLGSGLANFFEVEPGDWLTVLAKTQAGAYEALDLEVVGLIGSGNPLIDQNSFMLSLETARYMLDIEEEATEIAIRFSSTASESSTLRRIQAALSAAEGLEVKGWKDIEADFMALVQTKRTGQGVFMGIFVLLAVVGITNTILMASFERTREIGMLMAIGMRSAGIRTLFLMEGALTGLLGGAIGSVLSFMLIVYLASTGLDFTEMYGDMDIGYPVKAVFYPAISITLFAISWLVTGVLAALASYYPAARASTQNPVEALRYV